RAAHARSPFYFSPLPPVRNVTGTCLLPGGTECLPPQGSPRVFLASDVYLRHWADLWANWLLTRSGAFGRIELHCKAVLCRVGWASTMMQKASPFLATRLTLPSAGAGPGCRIARRSLLRSTPTAGACRFVRSAR